MLHKIFLKCLKTLTTISSTTSSIHFKTGRNNINAIFCPFNRTTNTCQPLWPAYTGIYTVETEADGERVAAEPEPEVVMRPGTMTEEEGKREAVEPEPEGVMRPGAKVAPAAPPALARGRQPPSTRSGGPLTPWS